MSKKETVIDIIRRLPDDVTVRDIIAVLQQHSSIVEEPDWSADELTEEEWDVMRRHPDGGSKVGTSHNRIV